MFMLLASPIKRTLDNSAKSKKRATNDNILASTNRGRTIQTKTGTK